MAPTKEEQRHFIAALCKVAWADGVVQDEERAYLHKLLKRFDPDAVAAEELDGWLNDGVPEAAVESLPPNLGEMLIYEAMRLAEADGDLDETEMKLLETVTSRLFDAHPKETPLAKVALDKSDPKEAN